MKRLTAKEEEIMRIFWKEGAMFVRELLKYYDEPKPIIIQYLLSYGVLKRKGLSDIKLMAIPISILP